MEITDLQVYMSDTSVVFDSPDFVQRVKIPAGLVSFLMPAKDVTVFCVQGTRIVYTSSTLNIRDISGSLVSDKTTEVREYLSDFLIEQQPIANNPIASQIITQEQINAGVFGKNIPNQEIETVVWVFRLNPLYKSSVVSGYAGSAVSSKNTNFVFKIGYNKVFSHTFVDANFQDISPSSKIQVAVPGQNGIPGDVTVSDTGINIYSASKVNLADISFSRDKPVQLLPNLLFAVTIETSVSNVDFLLSLNWDEKTY